LLHYEIAGSFNKDLNLMKKQHKDIPQLRDVMRMLIQEIPLPPKYKNHPLHGKYQGKWECHIEPDWLLIYRIEKTKRQIIFYRTGSHSDLY